VATGLPFAATGLPFVATGLPFAATGLWWRKTQQSLQGLDGCVFQGAIIYHLVYVIHDVIPLGSCYVGGGLVGNAVHLVII